MDQFLLIVLSITLGVVLTLLIPELRDTIRKQKKENRDLKARLKRRRFRILQGGKK